MACVDWSAVAPAWDRNRAVVEEMKAELTAELLDSLGPLAGADVLELGAGTGELAAVLADRTGPNGRVVASDEAPGMVVLLERRLAGRDGVEVARIDATAIDRPAGSFDAVVFRMGLMLLPEPDDGLHEVRRVLRPGGRFAGATWGDPGANPWLTSLGMAAMMHGVVQGGPPVGAGGPFSLADPEALEKRLRNAGFGEVTVVTVEVARRYADVDEYLGAVGALAPPLAAALGAAPAEKIAEVRGTLTGLLERFADGDGFRVPGQALRWVAS
jgi:SAM-dependent methyltransferase